MYRLANRHRYRHRSERTTSGASGRDHVPLVFRVLGSSKCRDCKTTIRREDFIFMTEHGGVCAVCGGISRLAFLPAGNAKLTLLAKRYSSIWHIVLQWSNARDRYARIGILVHHDALERARCIIGP